MKLRSLLAVTARAARRTTGTAPVAAKPRFFTAQTGIMGLPTVTKHMGSSCNGLQAPLRQSLLVCRQIVVADQQRAMCAKAAELNEEHVRNMPDMSIAQAMPRFFSELSNESLLAYCAHGDHDAHTERLIREVMYVDKINWVTANARVHEISSANKAGMQVAILPFKIGMMAALTGGLCSIPLCFHLETVMWFNDNFVTADVAEPKDLETWLEVGSWAWNWMEPPLGQISFFLLTLQFARNQMLNLGAKPYTHWLQQYRAKRLQKNYPQYNGRILGDFAISDNWT